MAFDKTETVDPLRMTTDQAAQDPSIIQTLGAAFRQSNMVGSFLSSEDAWLRMQGDGARIDRDYDVFADDLAGYEQHLDRFVTAFNPQATAAIKAGIDRETRDRKTLAASGWIGTGAEIGASVLDLPTLLPGGVLARSGGRIGYSALKGAGGVGSAAGAATAVQEAGLQATQQTRTGQESALAIGGSVLLGSLLGAGAGAIMARGEYKAASDVMQAATRDDFDVATDALHAELTTLARRDADSLSAAAVVPETLADFDVAGRAASAVAKKTAPLNPLLRTMHSPAKATREIAAQMMENPIYLKRNLDGVGDAAAETSMKEWTRGAVGGTVEAMDAAYTGLRKRGVAMTRDEFNRTVGHAMRRGDASDVPEVAQAAQAIRSKVFDPLKDRAVKAGLLPEDVSVDTAQSYFSRMWNRNAIEANEAEFKGILRSYFDGQIARAAEAATAKADEAMSALGSVKDAISRGMADRQADLDRLMQGAARLIPGEALDAFAEGFDSIAGRIAGEADAADAAKLARVDNQIAQHSRRGELDFLSDADRADYLNGIVDHVFATVTGRSHDGALPVGITVTKRGPLAERTFHIPDELVEPFLENNADLVMRRYARTIAADVELQERFGSVTLKPQIDAIRTEYADLKAALEARTDIAPEAKAKQLASLQARERADVRDLTAVRDMLRGNYRAEIQSTTWARILNGAMTFNYITALGGVVVSSLTDAVRPAMVHGLRSYVQDGLAPLIRQTRGMKLARQEAKEAGAIAERILHSRLATLAELTDPYAQGAPFERFLQNASVGFSKMTGLLHWNDFQKTLASTMTQNRILKNAEVAAARGFDALPKAERAYMGYLGIGNDSAELLGRLFRDHGETLDGVRVANSDAWPAELDHMQRAWRAAINKDVDSIIVSKGAGDVPLFASTPIGRAIIQFRSFALASNQRVLLRGLQEDQARFWGGVTGMAAIGSFIYLLKSLESGRKVSDNPGTWVMEGLDRSGIFSLGFEVNNALEKLGAPGLYTAAAAAFPNASQRAPASRFATRSAVGAYLGPSFSSATDAIGLMGTVFGGARQLAQGEAPDIAPSDVAAARRMVPFASLPYWRWLIDGQIVEPLKEAVK